jgi:hypothetical protein
VRWSKNDAQLKQGGHLQYTFDDLHRGQTLQAQANVSGIDGQRSDVVTVTGDVKLRPDLAVQALDAPEQAILNTLVNIAATVSELNGDVGAKGDCVLLVDDVEVDRAERIYVDSASAVTCAFTHTFDAVGTHALEVRVTDVVPGDWDPSNNAVTGAIEIVSPQIPFYWNASASTQDYTYSSRTDIRYGSGGYYGSGEESHSETNDSYIAQQMSLSGYASTAVRFPLARVSALLSADGVEIGSIDLENVAASSSWGDESYGGSGLYHFDPATYSYLYISTATWNGQGYTSAEVKKYAGTVTYFSRNYGQRWYYYYGRHSYAFNSESSSNSQYGSLWPMTSTAAIRLELEDADGALLEANADIPLDSAEYVSERIYSCDYYYYTSSGWQYYCTGYHQRNSVTSGYASGVD